MMSSFYLYDNTVKLTGGRFMTTGCIGHTPEIGKQQDTCLLLLAYDNDVCFQALFTENRWADQFEW